MCPPDNSNLNSKDLSLGEAAIQYLSGLASADKLVAQQEINRFVRWFGEQRLVIELKEQKVSDYAEQLAPTVANSATKFLPLKNFLIHLYKKGLVMEKLAGSLKIRKSQGKSSVHVRQILKNAITLTPEGYAELEAELISLQNERPFIAEEIRKAAADKDFKENAPLDAAKNYQGHVESRIKELEATLKNAIVIQDKQSSSPSISIGITVILRDLHNLDIIEYTLVDPREANPGKGKISIASPIGKALLGHSVNDEISVVAPAGMQSYKIELIRN